MDIDFTTFTKMYYSQAMVYLGKVENPNTQQIEKNVEQAEILISILALIQEKTKGNLTSEEEVLIDEALNQMRAAFAEQS